MTDPNGPSDDGGNERDGLGTEGTIPSGSQGVGIGAGEPSNFEPEEDPEAAPENASADEGNGFAGHS